jgi:CRP-like cAMP-binding protein
MPLNQLNKITSMSVFSGRPMTQIEALLQGAEEKALKHREMLYRMGDEAHSFAFVLQGALKLVKTTPAGDEVIMFFATPGDPVGALIMGSEQKTYPVSVVAMGPSLVLKIPRRTFVSVWIKYPDIFQKINSLIFARVHEMQEQKAMVKMSLPQKIARQLVSLTERFGADGGTSLPVPITRKEIADSVGATVESVIRVMSDWSRQGILQTSERQIEILRMDSIVEVLRGDKA